MAFAFFLDKYGGYFFGNKKVDKLIRPRFLWTHCQNSAYKFSSEEEGRRLLSEWWTPNPRWLTKEMYPHHKFIPVPD